MFGTHSTSFMRGDAIASRFLGHALAYGKPASDPAGDGAAGDERDDLLPRQEPGDEEAPDEGLRRGDGAAGEGEDAEEEPDGDRSADRPLQDALEQKRSADDPLGRADEPHDLDLLAVGEHRQ